MQHNIILAFLPDSQYSISNYFRNTDRKGNDGKLVIQVATFKVLVVYNRNINHNILAGRHMALLANLNLGPSRQVSIRNQGSYDSCLCQC